MSLESQDKLVAHVLKRPLPGDDSNVSAEKKTKISRDGPLVVSGVVPLRIELIICDASGTPAEWQTDETFPMKESYSLCRCGQSGDKPFCDGSHTAAGFKDPPAVRRPPFFEEADVIEGPGVILYDLPALCSTGKFCHRGGNVWRLAATSSDREAIATVIRDACDCPAGRLVAAERVTGKTIEPELEQSIGLIEMPAAKLSGPIWVKGGIPIESIEGWLYEVRNRVTLCRCGKSRNLPFCDGTHISIGFNDGTSSVR